MSEKLLYTLFLGGIGLLIGFLAQRSRMCFVAGVRDTILVGDTELLTGLFSFLVTVWVLTSVFYSLDLLDQRMPQYGEIPFRTRSIETVDQRGMGTVRLWSGETGFKDLLGRFFFASLIGGWLIGVLSVLAGGCVLRQHVLCAQGSRDSLLYLLGFYAAVPVYYLLLFKLFSWLYQ